MAPVSPVSMLKLSALEPWPAKQGIGNLPPKTHRLCQRWINPDVFWFISWGFSKSFSQGWSVLIFLSTSSWGCAPPGENASGFFRSTFGLRSLSRKWRPKMIGKGISPIHVVSMWSYKGLCWKTKTRQTICKFSENLLESQGVMNKFFIWCLMIHGTSLKLEKKLTARPWKWVVSQKERIVFQPSIFQGLC